MFLAVLCLFNDETERAMKGKRILKQVAVLAMLVWVLVAAVLVIRANLFTFQQQLYTSHNNLSASSLFLSLLKGHTLFILCFMVALMFLVLYIVTATGIDDIVSCAVMMLAAAGFVMCAWNRDVLFLTPSRLRLFWLHTHDSMLLLFAGVLASMLLPRLLTQRRLSRAASAFTELSLCALLALLWILPPVKAGIAMVSGGILLITVTLVLFVFQLYRRAKPHSYLESLTLLPPCLLMLLRASLFDLGSARREFYLHAAVYIIALYGIALCVYVLIWHLSNIFLLRSQNRRFEEVMKIKTDVSGLLVNYCRPPARQITALSSMALDRRYGELSPTRQQILFDLQDEANKLSRALRNIGEFEALPSATPPMQMQPIRLGTIFKYVMDEMPGPIVVLDNVSQWHEEYAMGEPYSLIRANTQFCSAIAEIRAEDSIHVDCAPDGQFIQVELSMKFNPQHLRQARRICNIVNKGSVLAGVEGPSDMTLYSTHSIFSRHGSPPRTDVLTEGGQCILRCRYSLQHCPPKARAALDAGSASDAPARGDMGDERQILLFSTSDEEIELITSYLAYEPYRVVVVTSEKVLLHDMDRLGAYALLIIGSAFMDNTIHDICWMIREHYTLGQLPILLVQRDPDLRTHIAAQKLANSVTTALSNRFEFCQKVHMLVELQASVRNTYDSRLAFLQAQMSPHFLFNTMNTIMAMCLNDPIEAYDLMGYFSQYLRGSLFSRDLDKPYPVYEEVDLLTAYLSIEKARFGEQISYEIESNVPDEWSILPMLVEPLAENSVKHGKHGNAPLHILVRLNAEGESLSVLVQDDGAGFDPQAQSQDAAGSEPHNKSIGLENVRARLKLYYNAPLCVDSAPGKGTRVSFTVNRLE